MDNNNKKKIVLGNLRVLVYVLYLFESRFIYVSQHIIISMKYIPLVHITFISCKKKLTSCDNTIVKCIILIIKLSLTHILFV